MLSPTRPRVPLSSLPAHAQPSPLWPPALQRHGVGLTSLNGFTVLSQRAWFAFRRISVCILSAWITCPRHCRVLDNSLTGLKVLGYLCSPLPSSSPLRSHSAPYTVSESYVVTIGFSLPDCSLRDTLSCPHSLFRA